MDQARAITTRDGMEIRKSGPAPHRWNNLHDLQSKEVNTDDAMEQAVDCLGSVIAFAMADKAEIRLPGRLKLGNKLIPVALGIAQKLALYLDDPGARCQPVRTRPAFEGPGDGRPPDAGSAS